MAKKIIATSQGGNTTESLILDAARKVFISKGLLGARMQEIADEAGINKALLHYYFRSKDKLFEAVLDDMIRQLLPFVKLSLESDWPVTAKVSDIVRIYISALAANPLIPTFIAHTLTTCPEKILVHIKKFDFRPLRLQQQLDQEAEKGLIRPMKAEHLLANVLSMCVFPFIAKPILMQVLEFDEQGFSAYLLERESEISEFVLKSIKPEV